MDQLNFFDSIFGEDFAEVKEALKEEPKKEKKEKKAAKPKPAKKSSVMVKTPCKVFLPYKELCIEEEGEINLTDFCKKIYEMGYKETSLLIPKVYEDDVYFLIPKTATTPRKTVAITGEHHIAAGELRAEYSEISDDESFDSITKKFLELNPLYENFEWIFDPKTKTAMPFSKEELKDDSFDGEKTLFFFGREVKKGVDETVSSVLENSLPSEIKDFTYIESDGKVFIFATSVGVAEPIGVIDAKASLKDVTLKYSLPISARIVELGVTDELTSDMFEGKEKVTADMVLEWAKKAYPRQGSTDGYTSVSYYEKQNLLAVCSTQKSAG